MRRYTLLFFLLVLGSQFAQAQLKVLMSSANADPGATVQVDVTVQDFTNLYGFQMSINYDSTILTYTGASNITASLMNFDATSIVSVLNNGPVVGNGEITANWFDGNNTVSLPSGTRLFTMNFSVANAPCDSSDVFGANTPIESNFIDANFSESPIVFTNGKVKVNGPNCGGGGGGTNTDLTFTITNRNVQNGQEVCIPIKVENFDGYNGGIGKFSWDPAVLSFVRVQNVTPGMYNANSTMTSSGSYNFLWENNDPGNPIVLPNNATFMEVCFNVVGAPGTMTTIDMNAFRQDWGFVDEAGADIIPVLKNGKITVTAEPTPPVIVDINDITINEDAKGCVSVKVQNFTNIQSFQGTFSWNQNVIAYDTVTSFGAIPGLDITDFNASLAPNRLRVTWNVLGTNPVTVSDNTEIFKLCFDAVAPCENAATSLVDIIDVNNFDIEFITLVMGVPVPADYSINSGSVAIAPCSGASCMVTNTKNVSCNGGSDGSVTVTVTDASGCQCIWYKDGSTSPFRTLNAPNCNLVDAPAGMYRLDVVCNGTVSCSSTATISQPSAINISESVTNIGCSVTTGSIALTVTGGTIPYTYKWSDAPMSTTRDVSNLPVGSYTVTVTDANSCSITKVIPITDVVTDLVVTETITNVNCRNESSGSISLNITGGCSQNGTYKVTPSVLTGLSAGSYTITVEDFSTPPNVITRSIQITQPDSVLALSGSTTLSNGSNGTISTTVLGGTKPYTISWTGGIPAGTFNPTGLAPGSYTATVVDANGCTETEVFVVNEQSTGGDVTISNLIVDNASCFGFNDGVIMASITSGVPPFTATLIRGNNTVSTINIAALGPFMVENISAGNYTLRVTDNNSVSSSLPVTVGSPPEISIDADVDCANGSNNDGSITLQVSGGNPPYSYEWSNTAGTSNLTNIGIGVYSVIVTDALGCQALANNLRVNDCNPTDCYEAMAIITPNEDGFNDAFVINCVMQEPTKLTIYDRWGSEVYSTSNYTNDWKGVDNSGNKLPQSSYMWVLEVDFSDKRKEIFKGTVTVLTEE